MKATLAHGLGPLLPGLVVDITQDTLSSELVDLFKDGVSGEKFGVIPVPHPEGTVGALVDHSVVIVVSIDNLVLLYTPDLP